MRSTTPTVGAPLPLMISDLAVLASVPFRHNYFVATC
jgi:hypothetical protein